MIVWFETKARKYGHLGVVLTGLRVPQAEQMADIHSAGEDRKWFPSGNDF